MATKLTWYGHATIGLETGGYHILVDPFFNGNPATDVDPGKVEADFILITHGHGDHVGDTLQIAKRTNAMVVSNYEIASWLQKQGVQKTHGQHLGGGFEYPFGYLKLTLALHGSAFPDGSYGGNPAGPLLTTEKLLKTKPVIQNHFNTWELITQDGSQWAKKIEEQTSTKVHLLQPGEHYTLE